MAKAKAKKKEKAKTIKGMTDKELINEVESYHQLINVVSCYGLRDLMFLDACEAELERRGYEISQAVSIHKRDGVDEEA